MKRGAAAAELVAATPTSKYRRLESLSFLRDAVEGGHWERVWQALLGEWEGVNWICVTHWRDWLLKDREEWADGLFWLWRRLPTDPEPTDPVARSVSAMLLHRRIAWFRAWLQHSAPTRELPADAYRFRPVVSPECVHLLVLHSLAEPSATADLIRQLPPASAPSNVGRVTMRVLLWALASEEGLALLPRLIGDLPPASVAVAPPHGLLPQPPGCTKEDIAAACGRLCSAEHLPVARLLLQKLQLSHGDSRQDVFEWLLAVLPALTAPRRRDLLKVLSEVIPRNLVFDAACATGCTETVDLLLSQGCSLQYGGSGGRPNSIAAAIHGGHLDVLRLFLDRNLLRGAGWWSRGHVCTLVEKCGPDGALLVHDHPHGISFAALPGAWLRAAAHHGHGDLLEQVLSHLPRAEWSQTLADADVLHVATVSKHLTLVRRLVINLGVDVNARGRGWLTCGDRTKEYEETALRQAICQFDRAMVDVLLEAGARVDERCLRYAWTEELFTLLLRLYPCGDTPDLNRMYRYSYSSSYHTSWFLKDRWPGAFVGPPGAEGSGSHSGTERERQWQRQQVTVAVSEVLPIHWVGAIVVDYLLASQRQPV